MIAPTLFDTLETPPAVHHIKASLLDKLVFTSFVNYTEETSKIQKLKACPLIVYDS